MRLFDKRTPLQKEWEKLEVQEQRFLQKRSEKRGEHSESETGGKDTAETSENIGYRFCEGICSDFRERNRGY